MEPLKNKYNKKLITKIAFEFNFVFNEFNIKKFIRDASKDISSLEMKERVNLIAKALELHLPTSFVKTSQILKKVIIRKKLENFELWPLSVYIEENGINDFNRSMSLLKEITKVFTSEFGVRPFYEKYPTETLNFFFEHAHDKDEHVRRWASEGTRPNLPWGKNVSHIQSNLKKHIKLLSLLKNDSSLYVRKSVANHMNDISWSDPDLVLKVLTKWSKNPSNDLKWIIKHALRNLLKQGHPGALQLLGFHPKAKFSIEQFEISQNKIKQGDSFQLDITIRSLDSKHKDFMVDYAIYYPKSNGKLSKKIFKGKNCNINKAESLSFSKNVSFKKVSTRVHYKGTHYLELQVNGQSLDKVKFELI